MIRPVLAAFVALWLVAILGACAPKIGDSCMASTDCSQDNKRVCDTFSHDGYCTIQGCDFGTCPEEATCVQFFPGLENAADCTGSDGNPDQDKCPSSEFCTIASQCAPRSIEQRFCMATCTTNGDCRDGYECRVESLMVKHGGQPVSDPTAATTTIPDEPFCAPRRPCTFDSDCDTGERCDPFIKVCE